MVTNFITRQPSTNMDALEPKPPMYAHIMYRVWQKLTSGLKISGWRGATAHDKQKPYMQRSTKANANAAVNHCIYLSLYKTKSWPAAYTVHNIPQKQPALLSEQDAVLGVRAEKGLSTPRIEVLLFKPQPCSLPKYSVTALLFYYIFEWWKTRICKKNLMTMGKISHSLSQT
jgi:hypothetical protein